MNKTTEVFLQLVRLGLGTTKNHYFIDSVNWTEIAVLAEKQGLTAIVVDGIENIPENKRPPQVMLLNLIGDVLQSYEQRYEYYKKAVSEIASFYNSHGFKMMVLKGYACSLNWPKPNHRLCGDIDIWQFGQWKEADAALAKEKGFKIDSSHHHHTVFYWRDFVVENHYDFINVHHHKSNVEIDKEFKQLAADDSYSVNVNGEKVYIPSPNLHALFLLRHAMNHFSTSEISLRSLIDWACFAKTHTEEIDWKWLLDRIEYYGMTRLYQVFNAICVEDLGFSSDVFPSVQFEPALKERVFKEIITPSFPAEEPKGIIRRIVFKYKRWKANGWKHELCFKDSMWSAFWNGVWSHILKPSSI